VAGRAGRAHLIRPAIGAAGSEPHLVGPVMDRAGHSACCYRGMHLATKATGFATRLTVATPRRRSEARRWRMLGSSASATAITREGSWATEYSADEKTCGIPCLLHCVWRSTASGAPSTAANLRRAAQYFGIDHSYHRDFIAIERLLRSPRRQPTAARELSIGRRHALRADFLEFSSR